MSEQRIAGDEHVRRSGCVAQTHAVDAAQRVLWMIQRVVKIRAQLHFESLLDDDVFRQREVDVVDARRRQDIAATVGKCADLRLNELCTGVVSQIRNGRARRVLQRRPAA